MRKFIYDTNIEAIEQSARFIADQIGSETDLFISGGSSFEIFKKIDILVSQEQKGMINLYQVDERYGEVGHDDSNWAMLNMMDISKYHSLHPILKQNADQPTTAQKYNTKMIEVMNDGHKKIAILGFGDDHHVAGMKPMSKDEFDANFKDKLVSYYKWTDFERVTLTYSALLQFDELIVFGNGSAKYPVIESLETEVDDYLSPIHGLLLTSNINIYYSKEG